MPTSSSMSAIKSFNNSSNKSQQTHPQPIKLTLAAARFMREQKLVMRNTNTKQLSSLHYKGGQCPESHSAGGIYSVPLWTVAISGITEKNQTDADLRNKIEQYKIRQINAVITDNTLSPPFVDTLDPDFLNTTVTQQTHLDSFLEAMNVFIQRHTSFGVGFNGLYDYELLVASIDNDFSNSLAFVTPVDDFNRYPTGGRVAGYSLGPHNIVYRVTFNSAEIALFKAIINKEYDEIIFQNRVLLNSDVTLTARYTLCHRLAVEIISAKLVRFLNGCGNLNRLIYLNKAELNDLVTISLNKEKKNIQSVIDNEYLSIFLGRDYLTAEKTYPIAQNTKPSVDSSPKTFNRYSTTVYKKFAANKLELDKLRTMYFFLKDVALKRLDKDPLHKEASNLLTSIERFCKLDVFNKQEMALLEVRYFRFQHRLRQAELAKQLKASTPEPDLPSPPFVPVQSPTKQITMHVLNGFLIALGVTAVAVAFTLLSTPIIGATALSVAGAGLISLAMGLYGLFNSINHPQHNAMPTEESDCTKSP
jgi:hypothetical protein